MSFNIKLAEVVRGDPRYAYEAYEFIFQALQFTQKKLGREPDLKSLQAHPAGEPQHHVSGRELLEGVRHFALHEFGLMARTVLHMWGIRKTADFGEIVFNLIDAGLMSRTPDDSKADFHDVFDLDQALVEGYQIQLDEVR